MSEEIKRCFVIMPFGEKIDADGKKIDFNEIYDILIEPAITGEAMQRAGGPPLECIRCDKIVQAGWVHRLMISKIYDADVAVVDLSTLNPNVFYELGVRHALRRAVTVLLCREGTTTPFNIAGFNCISYNPHDKDTLSPVRDQIARFVANGLRNGSRDSLVYEVLEEMGWEGPPPMQLTPEPPRTFQLRRAPNKRVGVITGGLHDVRGIDIWVNSENTNMQMARFYERSGSAVIRYYGAHKDETGDVSEDVIADELHRVMKRKHSVAPGTIIATSPGELKKRGVKWIFHAAAVQGQLGRGYRPVADVRECVRNALELANSPKYRASKCRSILFPLFGTGTAGAKVHSTVKELIVTAINYLENNEANKIEEIYFLALTDHQRDACLNAFKAAETDPVSKDSPQWLETRPSFKSE
jgi:O-acetyl-ADP-ribose deacetylase (regulator of RNase III)